MTDDDTKFERARRERPHIEAFARIVPANESTQPTPVEPPRQRPPVDMAEMLARWSALDEARGLNDEGPHRER